MEENSGGVTPESIDKGKTPGDKASIFVLKSEMFLKVSCDSI